MKRVLSPILMLLLLVACEKDQLTPEITDEPYATIIEMRDDNTAAYQVEELITLVEGQDILFGPKNSILVQLMNIKNKLQKDQPEEALTMLDELITHLEGLAADGTVDAAIIADLIDDVEWIRCEVDPECENLPSVEITTTGGYTYTLYVHPYDQRTGSPQTQANGVAWDPYPYDGDIGVINPFCGDLPNYAAMPYGPYSDGAAARAAALTDFDGEANTQKIVCALGDQGGIAYAAKVCTDLSGEEGLGFEDWYLPSLGELKAIYDKFKFSLGPHHFYGSSYWSSTEYNNAFAWNQQFYAGDLNGSPKYFINSSCRCVRRN